jgi:hypothetical protein
LDTAHIRFGFEITIESHAFLPMLLALSPHPDFDGVLFGSSQIRTEPAVPIETYSDTFGNQFSRIVAPKGEFSL